MAPGSGSGLSDVRTRSPMLMRPYTSPTSPSGRSRVRTLTSAPAAPTLGAVSITSSASAARSGPAGCAGFQNTLAPPAARAGGGGRVGAATRQSSVPALCWPIRTAGANPARSREMRCMANVYQLNYLQAFRTLGPACAYLSCCLPLAFGYPSKPPTRRGCSRSEEHTSELQSLAYLVCRLLLEKKNI